MRNIEVAQSFNF